MTTLTSRVHLRDATFYNSRSGATPLPLHYSCQKVNSSCKIQNQKKTSEKSRMSSPGLEPRSRRLQVKSATDSANSHPAKSQSLYKIQNQKRQEKSQGCHHRDSNPDLPASKSKAVPLLQIPTPLQGAPREWRSSSLSYVPDNKLFARNQPVTAIHR